MTESPPEASGRIGSFSTWGPPAALLAALALTYWDSWLWLWQQSDGRTGYGIIVIALALIIAGREIVCPSHPRRSRTATVIGILLLIGGITLHVAATSLLWSRSVLFLSIIPSLAGLILIFSGLRALALAWTALPLLMIGLPAIALWASTRLGPVWQLYSSAIAAIIGSACGVTVIREGIVLRLPQTTLQVAPECSGLQTLTGILALVLALSGLRRARFGATLAAIAVTAPVALIINSIRLAAVLIAGRSLSGETVQRIHDDLELPTMLVAAVVGVTLAQRFFPVDASKPSQERSCVPAGWPAPRFAWWAVAVIGLAGLVRIPPILGQTQRAARLSETNIQDINLPDRVGEWRLGTHKHYADHLNWSYRDKQDLRVEVLAKKGQEITPLECVVTKGFPVVMQPKHVQLQFSRGTVYASHMIVARPVDGHLLSVIYWLRNLQGFLPDPPATLPGGVPALLWDDPRYTDTLFVRFLIDTPPEYLEYALARQGNLMQQLFPTLDAECVRLLRALHER